ncbi:hypothetical protein GJ700_02505 [Duganella sp. FT92W]|uniref:Uncharacterized protein n=1 Tax=Pseudoduganella rivuli TaxID=2666085 RepID=A0A7X2LPS1_9BURK|nr:hypothetical protein [Pseudoduganella rivuli]MRV70590.1 hypothetical protein [Pseudoduganella rivuli]
MTFVAVLYADYHPLIVADSLVSRRDNTAPGIPTPLLNDPDARPGQGYRPVGLGRKFWLLPDRSLFLYSGTIGSAQKLFDHLRSCVTASQCYDNATHLHAREFRETHTQCDFSFLVITSATGEIELFADGTVHQGDIPGYGYVLAIGTGASHGLDILRRYPGISTGSINALLGNALNAAAILTQDYKDDWGTGSMMSAASCGGYFEVVPPTLYEKGFEHLYRGTAQIFLTSDSLGTMVSRFVAANQGDEETVIVVGGNLDMPLTPQHFPLMAQAYASTTFAPTEMILLMTPPSTASYRLHTLRSWSYLQTSCRIAVSANTRSGHIAFHSEMGTLSQPSLKMTVLTLSITLPVRGSVPADYISR